MGRRPKTSVALASAVALAAAAVVVASSQQVVLAAPSTVAVTVNARAGLAAMPSTALGINDAVWDSQLGTTAVSDLLHSAGVGMMRYPGGSYGDIYHWKTHTADGGFVAPGTDFDTFIASTKRVGAQPMIIANYGTGTPAEAADWVRDANVTKGYGVRYWTVGNENYGNGHYGATWEADNHADKSPAGYAAMVRQYSEAMKAVDPTIKVGAVLTMPANWPDGLVGSGDSDTWNAAVLSGAGSAIDFVDVHWYPGGSTAAESLTKATQIDDALYLLHRQIARYAGANASRLGISFTETNVGTGLNTQPGALYLADIYSGLLENGAFTVHWWNVHNGIGNVSTVAGQRDYGDFGILSSATCLADGVTCEPALNTPFAPYHALSLMNTFVRPGDQFVRAATDDPLVTAHAARRPDGDLAVLLLNKDPDNSHAVSLSYSGYAAATATPTVYSYLNGASAVTSAAVGTATSQTLAPYSLSVILLHPANPVAGPPGAPGVPTATTTDTTATISWPAATAGGHPVAKYEVYRQNGATSEQLGETPQTSFTVRNLRPGSRYTVNVLARDTSGAVSFASPPLTLTTTAPATSTCAVRFVDVNDWGSGYVASVDVINNGQNPIDGWTLTFGWPTGWQRMDGGWNATWVQTGTTVTVTSLAGAGKLAAGGGSVNIGFVGGYSGPNVVPSVFTLNGTVCSSA